MPGLTDLDQLLARMQPRLLEGDFVFCTVTGKNPDALAALEPLASYREQEGLSLVLTREQADSAGLGYEAVFRGITLSVHSSLEAVGFTAAVAGRLAEGGIAANIIAAYHHDHVFVPAAQAETALQLLTGMTG